MKMTLSQLILEISRREKELYKLEQEVLRNSMEKIDRDLNGTETLLSRDLIPFDRVMDEYLISIETLNRYKIALNNQNQNIFLDNGNTIAETLIIIKNLRKRVDLLDILASKTETMARRSDANISVYYSVSRPTYNVAYCKNDKTVLENIINSYEAMIQNANASTYVEL